MSYCFKLVDNAIAVISMASINLSNTLHESTSLQHMIRGNTVNKMSDSF